MQFLANEVGWTLTTCYETYTDIINTEVQVQQVDTRIVPTINVHDFDSEPDNIPPITPSKPVQDVPNDDPVIPGELAAHPAPAIPSWYKVGWRQMSGIDNAPLQDGEEKDKGILDVFLSEQFYGSWYHNAAIIVFVRFRVPFCLSDLIEHFSGCFRFPLLNPLWLRLGLVVHCPCHL